MLLKPKVSVQTKVQKEFPEFVDEVVSLNVEDLRNRLVSLSQNLDVLEDTKENDEDLSNTREKLKELSAPYREGSKAIKLKTKYIISLIKEKGGE